MPLPFYYSLQVFIFQKSSSKGGKRETGLKGILSRQDDAKQKGKPVVTSRRHSTATEGILERGLNLL